MDCSKTRRFLMGSWSKVSEFIKKINFAARRDGRAPGTAPCAPAAAAGQGIPNEPSNQPTKTSGDSGSAHTKCLEWVAPGEVPLGAAVVVVLIPFCQLFAFFAYLICDTY